MLVPVVVVEVVVVGGNSAQDALLVYSNACPSNILLPVIGATLHGSCHWQVKEWPEFGPFTSIVPTWCWKSLGCSHPGAIHQQMANSPAVANMLNHWNCVLPKVANLGKPGWFSPMQLPELETMT
jgi:hypothetical protein